MAGWNMPARNAAINKRPCDKKGVPLVTAGRDNIGREDIDRPTCTEAACGRRSWMSALSSAFHNTGDAAAFIPGRVLNLHRCHDAGRKNLFRLGVPMGDALLEGVLQEQFQR